MREKNQVVPDEMLSKEFLSRFKTESDVSKFLKQLHAQVLEKMLEGEMDAHLGYEKNSVAGNNSGNSRNGSYPKRIQTEHGKAVISIPRDRNGQFEPIAVPKHESRGLSIEKLVISLYAKGMSVSDIETLSKILCKCKQDSVVSSFLYLDSVFKNEYKLIHNQSPVMNRLCPFLLNLHN